MRNKSNAVDRTLDLMWKQIPVCYHFASWQLKRLFSNIVGYYCCNLRNRGRIITTRIAWMLGCQYNIHVKCIGLCGRLPLSTSPPFGCPTDFGFGGSRHLLDVRRMSSYVRWMFLGTSEFRPTRNPINIPTSWQRIFKINNNLAI